VKYVLLVALMLSGCATSGTGKGTACVEQPDCMIGCIVKDVKCEPKEKDDGPG
jgi:hypothetical protein